MVGPTIPKLISLRLAGYVHPGWCGVRTAVRAERSRRTPLLAACIVPFERSEPLPEGRCFDEASSLSMSSPTAVSLPTTVARALAETVA